MSFNKSKEFLVVIGTQLLIILLLREVNLKKKDINLGNATDFWLSKDTGDFPRCSEQTAFFSRYSSYQKTG
ncbi:MAG: hypothetical protein ACJAUY_001639 [Cognaticolwellia sp.]|jgi:hypothetical protein